MEGKKQLFRDKNVKPTEQLIAESLGEQQVTTVDCISSLQHLKIMCLAFFPPFGSDSVCVCVCV